MEDQRCDNDIGFAILDRECTSQSFDPFDGLGSRLAAGDIEHLGVTVHSEHPCHRQSRSNRDAQCTRPAPDVDNHLR